MFKHVAWEALTEQYNSHTKETRRVRATVSWSIQRLGPGQDLDASFFVLDESRGRLEEMGQTVHDERYEGIILQAFLA